ncbi:hypothetical protein ASPCAL08063 [Aspergillus calidoustus]|uniref:Uncharacterized protein n=1 Tax=Aspergillus calidoustus TaxID=454130 RepID=A0A0U5GSX0_ASPCI|nr:hypothetical protein ASPCAL08063 [Aspergillus calidoustus]
MAQFPQDLGDSGAGTVVAFGPGVERRSVGDKVFGFFFHNEEKGQQVSVTAPEHLFGRTPEGVSLAAAATLPTNFTTAFYTLPDKFGLSLTSPRFEEFSSGDDRHTDPHLGRRQLQTESPSVLVRAFDCLASKFGSLQHIAQFASLPGSVVAAVLPVVIRAPSDKEGIHLSADVAGEAPWASGVEVHSVVSYAYEANAFWKDHLQPDIVLALLTSGAIEPNKYQVIEGDSLLQRASTAMDTLRSGTVSS